MTVAVSAHKGGSEDAPSGTLRAYESAVSIGAEYVEFDIRRTRDGRFVVFHDPVIEGRQVNELTFDELCTAAGYRVPRVREVMELIAGKAIGHLDLKEIGHEAEIIGLALRLLGPGNFVATLLYGVKPSDALTYCAMSLVLLVVAFLASAAPAYRAAQTDPMSTLRTQ